MALNRRAAILLVPTLLASGCSLATAINRNIEAIENSSAAIGTNTEAVRESTTATGSLEPALRGVERLRAPMEAVAGLDPTLRSVASLPMTRVAELDGSMRALAALQQPMTNLVAIGPALDRTAALDSPMSRVADMRPSLDADGAPCRTWIAARPPMAADWDRAVRTGGVGRCHLCRGTSGDCRRLAADESGGGVTLDARGSMRASWILRVRELGQHRALLARTAELTRTQPLTSQRTRR